MAVRNAIRLRALDGLLVCIEVEVDEQSKVAGEQTTSEERRAFCAVAVVDEGELVGDICVDEVLVCCKSKVEL